jgi:hypothetical protein
MRALAYCRDLAAAQADAMGPLPFADGAFDAVFMLDVLEHLADPAPLVGELGRVLTPGGLTVIMVPARPELWSYWDEMHGHQRRYTKPSLAAVFGEGWMLEALEYSFSWMYPFVWAFRRVMQGRRRSPAHSDFIEIPRPLNALQIFAGRCEGAMQRFLPAPVGSTLCGLWSWAGRPAVLASPQVGPGAAADLEHSRRRSRPRPEESKEIFPANAVPPVEGLFEGEVVDQVGLHEPARTERWVPGQRRHRRSPPGTITGP